MGDTFGEGVEDETPTHRVTLDSFYLAPFEVTVKEFRVFVEETGYTTSAEGPVDLDAHRTIMRQASSRGMPRGQLRELHDRILRFGGAGHWDADKRAWIGYNPQTTWKNPGFEQTDNDPVVAVSWDDAVRFCNWLSARAGLPPAYDLQTGRLLDRSGNPTSGLVLAGSCRLPTEAEWEYAAREGGRLVRFGNGRSVARSSEMNFRGDEGEYAYLELGDYPGRTVPVGSYSPNSLGLYDMSGNAWEWVSDDYAPYSGGAQVSPYVSAGAQVSPYVSAGDRRTLRGGRWGGDAFEARVSHRSAHPRNDRCNNSGFRIARSAD